MAFKAGDKVRLLFGSPTGEPLEATVKVVQDEVGKKIGLEFDSLQPYGHSLDGLVEEREDPSGQGPTVGKGWWVTEDDIEKL